MMENRKLTLEELNEVTGGTISESNDLVIPLEAAGHGVFLTADTGRSDIIDIEGMQRFFSEKGYDVQIDEILGKGDEEYENDHYESFLTSSLLKRL